MTRKDLSLKLLQITDTHLHAAADSRMRGVTTYTTFRAVLDQAQRDPRWPVDAILATGDIVQDESRAGYERFRSTLEPLGVPVYSIPGNHDDPALMGEILANGSFHLGGELRKNKWSVVLLSTFLAGEMGYQLKTYLFTSGPNVGQVRGGTSSWPWGYPSYSFGTTQVPMNTKTHDANLQLSGLTAFRSDHAAGCNFLFADGSVRFLKDGGLDLANYQVLGTRAGSKERPCTISMPSVWR